jgi:hypothetical protein
VLNVWTQLFCPAIFFVTRNRLKENFRLKYKIVSSRPITQLSVFIDQRERRFHRVFMETKIHKRFLCVLFGKKENKQLQSNPKP